LEDYAYLVLDFSAALDDPAYDEIDFSAGTTIQILEMNLLTSCTGFTLEIEDSTSSSSSQPTSSSSSVSDDEV